MWTRALAVAVLLLYMGVATFELALQRLTLDPGFTCAPEPGAACLVQSVRDGGSAQQAGLRPGDRVLSADSTQGPDETQDLRLQAVRGEGPPFDLRVTASVPPLSWVLARPATQHAIGDAVRTLAALLILVGVAFARPTAIGVRALLVAGAAVACAAVLNPSLFGPLAGRLGIPIEGQSNVPTVVAFCALLHLSLVMPARHPLLRRLDALVPRPLKRWFDGVIVLYAAMLVCAILIQNVPYAGPGDYDAYYGLMSGLFALLLLTALAAFVRSYRHPPNPLARAQLRWLVIGIAPLGLTFAAQSVWSTLTGAAAPEVFLQLTPTFGLLLVLTFALAVLRYRLFDVDRVLRLTVSWLLLAVVLLVGFVGVSFLGSRAAVGLIGPAAASDPTSSVIAALLVAAVAYPGQRLLQQTLDRRVFRERAARGDLLRQAESVLQRAQPADVVVDFLTETTPRTLGLARGWLVLAPPVASLTDIRAEPSSRPFKQVPSELAARVRAIGEPLLLASGSDQQAYADVPFLAAGDPVLSEWYAAGIRVIIPLIADISAVDGKATLEGSADLVGLWTLSGRANEVVEREDLQVLGRVGRLAALLLVVQAQGRERERMDHELAIAQVVQHTLLPADPPRLAGWRLSARYQPARVVGGDFYDFITLGDGRLGIAIGDVSGKDVPAALVMASTQSILRAAAVSGAAPAKVLTDTNALLHERLSAGMYVTCQYAVLDPSSGRFKFSNAGHCPPYLRSSTGLVEVPTAGLPLGVAPDAYYEETCIDLDMVATLLLYSDGVVEARGPTGELFGFPRLAETIQSHTGASLADDLLETVRQFRETDAPPDDDVTLVIIERA